MDIAKIGMLIRDARKSKGLTQTEAGQPIGMSRATISGLETGNINEIGLRKTIALCASLGLELSCEPRRKYPTLQELRRESGEK